MFVGVLASLELKQDVIFGPFRMQFGGRLTKEYQTEEQKRAKRMMGNNVREYGTLQHAAQIPKGGTRVQKHVRSVQYRIATICKIAASEM